MIGRCWQPAIATELCVIGDAVVSVDGLNAVVILGASLTAATTYYVQTSGVADLAGQQGMFTRFRTTP